MPLTPEDAMQFINKYVVIEVSDTFAEGGKASACGYLVAITKYLGETWLDLDWGFGMILDETTTIKETTPEKEGDTS